MIRKAASVADGLQISFIQTDLLVVIALATVAVLVFLTGRKDSFRPFSMLVISVFLGEFLPTVFEQYESKSNLFWYYLQNVQDVYGVTDSMLVVNKPSDYQGIEELTVQQKKEYKTYYLLQYGYI